jgi:hypothetical protein
MLGGLLHFLSWRHVTLHLIISITPSSSYLITIHILFGWLLFSPPTHLAWRIPHSSPTHLDSPQNTTVPGHPGLSDPQPWLHMNTPALTRHNRVPEDKRSTRRPIYPHIHFTETILPLLRDQSRPCHYGLSQSAECNAGPL